MGRWCSVRCEDNLCVLSHFATILLCVRCVAFDLGEYIHVKIRSEKIRKINSIHKTYLYVDLKQSLQYDWKRDNRNSSHLSPRFGSHAPKILSCFLMRNYIMCIFCFRLWLEGPLKILVRHRIACLGVFMLCSNAHDMYFFRFGGVWMGEYMRFVYTPHGALQSQESRSIRRKTT